MARLDDHLAALDAAWESIPADRRVVAAPHLIAAAEHMARGIVAIGDAGEVLGPPMIGAFLQAIQDCKIWGKSPEWVAERVEARFPALAAVLRAFAADGGPAVIDAVAVPSPKALPPGSDGTP